MRTVLDQPRTCSHHVDPETGEIVCDVCAEAWMPLNLARSLDSEMTQTNPATSIAFQANGTDLNKATHQFLGKQMQKTREKIRGLDPAEARRVLYEQAEVTPAGKIYLENALREVGIEESQRKLKDILSNVIQTFPSFMFDDGFAEDATHVLHTRTTYWFNKFLFTPLPEFQEILAKHGPEAMGLQIAWESAAAARDIFMKKEKS